jgi:hypothetical protein
MIAVGAVIGAIVDDVITRRVTVFTAGRSSGRPNSVTIGPFVMRDRSRLQVAVTF